IGGGLATLWAISQKVITQIVLYGAPMLALYRELLSRAEAWLSLPRSGGVLVVLPFATIVAAIGVSAAIAGHRAGRLVRKQRAS
ncbi:MAG: hypothetical protein FWD69_14270, partial [Polyangiaceae bacterium]|nr:hypothetical protein [Polyangiaceae bacterium]